MRTQTLHLLVVGLLMATAFAALVPTAEAQTSQYNIVMSLNAPSERVKPLQGPISFQGTLRFSGEPSNQGNLVGIPVEYKVTKAPAWAAVTISPGTDVITPTGNPPTLTGQATFTVSVTASDQAPAFQADSIEVTATARPSVPNAPQKTASQSVPIVADYFSILDVQLAQNILQDRPQAKVTFPVTITNLGNGATKVSFEIPENGNTKGLDAPLPIPVTLQSKQAGGTQISAEIPIQLQLPYKNGYMNDVGVVTYKITSHYALDPKLQGDTTNLSIMVTTKGFYVPGPGILAFIGMLGAAALVLRRRSA